MDADRQVLVRQGAVLQRPDRQLVTGRSYGCGYTYLQTQQLSPGWTNVTVAGGNRVLFYNRSTGTGATGYFDTGGVFHQQQLYSGGFARGWTHIVGDDAGNMLFYASPSPIVTSLNGLYAGATGSSAPTARS